MKFENARARAAVQNRPRSHIVASESRHKAVVFNEKAKYLDSQLCSVFVKCQREGEETPCQLECVIIGRQKRTTRVVWTPVGK